MMKNLIYIIQILSIFLISINKFIYQLFFILKIIKYLFQIHINMN